MKIHLARILRSVGGVCVALLALLALSVNLGARELDFLGVAEVGHVDDWTGVTFSPDGRHAYVLGRNAGVFEVSEAVDGMRLEFVHSVQLPGVWGVDDRRIFFSTDGETAFVERFRSSGLLDPPPPGSHRQDFLLYDRDSDSGRLTLRQTYESFTSMVSMDPERRHLYSTRYGELWIHRVEDGEVVEQEFVPIALLTDGVVDSVSQDLQASPDGSFVAAAGFDGVGVLRRDTETGSLDSGGAVSEQEIAELGRIRSLRWTSDSRFLFVVTRFSFNAPGGLVILEVDRQTGELTHLATEFWDSSTTRQEPLDVVDLPDGRGVVSWRLDTEDGWAYGLQTYQRFGPPGLEEIVFLQSLLVPSEATSDREFGELRSSPGGERLLLAGELGVRAFDWDPDSALLGDEEPVEIADDGVGLRQSVNLAAHPSGRWLYATSRDERAVVTFERTANRGLDLVDVFDDLGTETFWWSHLEVSPDGRHLYATETYSGSLGIYEIDPATGVPSLIAVLVEGADTSGLEFPQEIESSPDGRWLVVESSGLSLFERDVETGLVVLRQTVSEILSGVSLWPIRSVTWSADGRHVYAVTTASGELAPEAAAHVLELDAEEGRLEGVQTVPNGTAGITGMVYPTDVVATPDGRHVVVSALDGLFVFERAPVTGRLEYLATTPTETWPLAIAIDGDGERVVAALQDYFVERVELFLRDPDTGSLERLETLDNAEVGVEGLGTNLEYDGTNRVAYTAGRPGKVGILGVGSNGPCLLSADRLCLGDDRFEVRVQWRDSKGNEGDARVAPARTDDSGVFYFFAENNWEMLVKVLDGCTYNDRFWVYAATASTVETTLTVTDKLTGDVRSYFNPLGRARPALTDTNAFATCDAKRGAHPSRAESPSVIPTEFPTEFPAEMQPSDVARTTADKISSVPPFVCQNSPTVRCLGDGGLIGSDGRFQVEIDWRKGSGATGPGRAAVEGTVDSALFWFFGADNWEVLVKVLDACTFNGHHWVFGSATTTVGFTLRITDSVSGEVREYVNPPGQAASALADVEAFGVCP